MGSILPRNEGPTDEHAAVTDDESKIQPVTEQDTIAARVVPAEPQLETADECVDDIAMTGPAPQRSAPLAEARPNRAGDVDGLASREQTEAGPKQR